MVLPLRETPGITAKACATPMVIESAIETWPSVLLSPAEILGHPHNEADADGRCGDQIGAAEAGFRLFFKQHAGDGPRNRSRGQQPQQHAVLAQRRIAADVQAESVPDDLHPILEKISQHGGQRPDVQRDVEDQTAVIPAKQPRNDDQVRAAAHREKFRQALDDAENDRVDKGHP